MPIAMTAQQERDFTELEFIVLDDFFTPSELKRFVLAVDEVVERIRSRNQMDSRAHFQVRNVLAHHEAILDLVDHPRMLPLVVDAIGWNIQIRTSHLDFGPPYPVDLEAGQVAAGDGADQEAGYRNIAWHPDLASPEIFQAPSLDGRLPFMELKVFYPLYDMSESDCGNLWLVPGSHLRTPQELQNMQRRIPAEQAVELKLPAGSAMLWRAAVWHCVGPNRSRKTRKIILMGYHYRSLRPTDYTVQDATLVARCSPVRRQLLGATPDGGNPLGDKAEVEPASRYWNTAREHDVPLRAWAAAFAEAPSAT